MGQASGTFLDILEAVSTIQDQGYTFIQDDGSEIQYPFQELVATARRRAGELQALGMQKGDRVALVLPNPYDFVISFLGAVMAGVQPVPLYPPHSLGRLKVYFKTTAEILKASGTSVLLSTKQLQAVLWPVTEEARALKTMITIEKITSRSPITFQPVTMKPEDTAFIQFTSGSTAHPKGVVVSHASLVANARGIIHEGMHAKPHVDKGLSWLPLYHDMGLIGFVIAPMFPPLSVVFLPTLSFMKRPAQWLELIHKHRATITAAPNFAYALMAQRATDEQVQRWDLSCLRHVGCGAEPISPDVMRTFLKRFAPAGLKPASLLPCYGMAEATLAIAFKPYGTLWHADQVDEEVFRTEGRAVPATNGDLLEFVSCGRPFFGHELRIVDPRGNPLPERTVGEIEVRGPSVTQGYYHNPAATEAVLVDQRLRTGDLGYLAEGELYVTGRKKDLIIINGRNYYPQTLEWLIEELPGVRKGNVVAFSRPGAKGTEELVIVCEVCTDEPEQLRDSITRRIAEEVGLAVGAIVFLAHGVLPKTSSGKLQRQKTRDMYTYGTLTQEGVRTLGQRGQIWQLASYRLRALFSRFRHAIRRTHHEPKALPLALGKCKLPPT